MAALTPPAQALNLQLAQLGRDFICTTPLPASRVQLRFLGPFQGQTVVWDMQLGTLADCRQTRSASAVPCPFIEIAEGTQGVHPIAVGLELAIIDEPVIRKTIIMVRNYKRLKIGKIEFCPAVADN
jgi:hypothetical protein